MYLDYQNTIVIFAVLIILYVATRLWFFLVLIALMLFAMPYITHTWFLHY